MKFIATLLFIIMTTLISFVASADEQNYLAEEFFENSDGSITLIDPFFNYSGEKYPFTANSNSASCMRSGGRLFGLDLGICKLNGFKKAIYYSRRSPDESDPVTQSPLGEVLYIGADIDAEAEFRNLCFTDTYIKSITCK